MEFNQNLYYSLDGKVNQKYSVSVMKFPGGEVGVNINSGSKSWQDGAADSVRSVELVAKIQNSDHLMAMFLATDAIRRVYTKAKVSLVIPYFPYARQDRVCNDGEAFSVKVVAMLINAQDYESVTTVDPHSTVLIAALDKCKVVSQYDLFAKIKQDWHNWTIVAPDMGAMKKCEEFAKLVGTKAVVGFSKTRDLASGKITGMTALFEVDANEQYLVLDDICDGGRTFIELVELMSRAGHLELVVSHGIFSKGVDVLTSRFDRVYTSNSLPQSVNEKLCVVEYK